MRSEKPPYVLGHTEVLLLFGPQCNDGILLGGLSGGDQTADDGQYHAQSGKDQGGVEGQHRAAM